MQFGQRLPQLAHILLSWLTEGTNLDSSAFLGCRIVALAQDPLVAVSSARLHHQLLPDTVAAEEWHTAGANFSTPASTLSALRRRGHNVTATDWGAACQLVVVEAASALSDPVNTCLMII